MVGVVSPVQRLQITSPGVLLRDRDGLAILVLPRLLLLWVRSTVRLKSSQSTWSSLYVRERKGVLHRREVCLGREVESFRRDWPLPQTTRGLGSYLAALRRCLQG